MFYRKQIANNTFTTGSLSSWSMGITLGNTLLSLGRVFSSALPHTAWEKHSPHLHLWSIPGGRNRERPYKKGSHHCPSPAVLSWVLWDFVCICSLLQHVMERIYLPRTSCHRLSCCLTKPVSHSRLPQMFLFSELTGNACTAALPEDLAQHRQRRGGILHLTPGARRLLVCRSRVGPGSSTSQNSGKEPLLNK